MAGTSKGISSMKKQLLAVLAFCGFATSALADGLITIKSANNFDATHVKLVSGIASRGFALVADVDHAKGAQSVGATLAPTRLLIFGNPRGGTVLMACHQSAGIDLPLKALLTKGADGVVLITYNDPVWVATRHGLGDCGKAAIEATTVVLKALVAEAATQ